MAFYSIGFAIFLGTLWLASRWTSPSMRQWTFLAASYFFYWTWSGWFLILLLLVSLFDFAWGKLLVRSRRAVWLWIGIIIQLSALAASKTHLWGATPGPPEGGGLLVPIGVSFFTFQGLSYLIDIYRGFPGSSHPRPFLLYMSFWPTILSGPICRAPEMLPQFESASPLRRADLWLGLQRIILGMFLKMVLAQSLLERWKPADGRFNLLDLFLVAFGLGIWLYLDFAGYSHIACGAARILGIRLRENFDFPYNSLTPQEFWTRWHMSLSSWIRDYIFFPLSILRPQLAWRYGVLVLSMVLFGIWHGLTLGFALWGAYQGLLLVVWRWMGPARSTLRARTVKGSVGRAMSWAATLLLVCFGWLLFWTRATEWAPLLQRLDLWGESALPTELYRLVLVLWVSHLGLGWLASGRALWRADSWLARAERSLSLPVSVVMFLLLLAMAGGGSPFAYVSF